MNKASAGIRLLAYLIDLLLTCLIYLLLIWWVVSARETTMIFDRMLWLLISFISIFTIFMPIYLIYATSRFGGTIGKLICGIEVVNHQGKRTSLLQAFFRNSVGYMVSGLFFWLGFIWITIDKDRRAWHDMIANSLVVVKRESGIVVGIVAFFLLIAANILIGIQNWQTFRINQSLYQEMGVDMMMELQKNFESDASPSPIPTDASSLEL